MTPTEKRYLLFLSPRTPRPKSCDRPGPAVLRAMASRGWIASGPARKFGPPDIHITPAGEAALDQEADKACVERGRVEWRGVKSMPTGARVLVTDGQIVTVATREDDLVIAPGYPVTRMAMWTHWAAFPSPPAVAVAEHAAGGSVTA